MPVIIEMPKLSDTMTEGTLVRWLKQEGDAVAMGDVLAEIETDKATMEMESFDEGILHEICVPEGAKVPLGGKLAVLLEEGEEPPEGGVGSPGDAAADAAPGSEAEAGAPAAVVSLPAPQAADGRRVKASPLARRIALARGLDLGTIRGSGPGGRIVRRDVEAAPAMPAPPAPAVVPAAAPPAASPPLPPPAPGEGDERLPLSGMRTVIAERLLASKTRIPHFYLHVEVDAAPLMELRRQLNAVAEEGGNQYTVNDFVLKGVIDACVAVPEVNAAFDGDAIIRYADVDLSVAIAVEDGLVTPVIRGAQSASLLDLSRAVKELAVRARERRLTPEEMAGGTVTVSNLGGHGVDSFDAIINPPQASIIAVGAARRVPVVSDAGEVVPGLRMDIGMSCDHRVIDGAVGARYLAALRRALENPALLLL